MRLEVNYSPTPRQRAFHESREDEVLYGGAAGGGKTTAIVMDAFLRCARHPGTIAYLFRRTYRELEDTLLPEALRRIPRPLYRYMAQGHEMRLCNGSTLRFRHCQKDADRFLYQGAPVNRCHGGFRSASIRPGQLQQPLQQGAHLPGGGQDMPRRSPGDSSPRQNSASGFIPFRHSRTWSCAASQPLLPFP